MIAGVPKESTAGERRVALVPGDAAKLAKKKIEVHVESGAGLAAGYTDDEYAKRGATLVSRQQLFQKSDLVLYVRGPTSPEDLRALRAGQVVIGFLDPLGSPDAARRLAETKVTALAMELMPRITRAQSMDALSSMANIAGYRAVLLAATHLQKLFPMLITAAGTISPAKVFVLGAGVAGLQAIATARRLGAQVEAYDVRPEVKEQVESVGGKFVDLGLTAAADAGGYAKAQSAEFYQKQQQALGAFLAHADAVITTAAVPGRRAPILVTRAMVDGMRPGAVVVDLAAETGGNCELTKAGERVEHKGVLILGPLNVPGEAAYHASQMYSRNVSTFVDHLVDNEGTLKLEPADEIVGATCVTRDGAIVSKRVQEALQARAAS